MAINRFTQLNTLENNASPFELPVQELALVLDAQQKRFDESRDIAEELEDKSIQALPEQRARANAILQDVRNEVESVVGDFNGNFARANSSLRDLKRKVNRMFSSGGEAFQIESNAQEHQKFFAEQAKRDDINPTQLANARSFISEQFQSLPNQDPETGQFKSISELLNPLASNVDIGAEAFDIAENISPQKLKQEGFVRDPEFGNHFVRKIGNKVEFLGADRIKRIVGAQLQTNPKIQNFVFETLRFSGQEATVENINNILDGYASIAADAFQKNDVETTQSLITDPKVMLGLREESQKRLQDRQFAQKKQLLSMKESKENLRKNYITRFSNNNVLGNKGLQVSTDPVTGVLSSAGGESFNIFGNQLRDPREEFKAFQTNRTSSGNKSLDVVFQAIRGEELSKLKAEGHSGRSLSRRLEQRMEEIGNMRQGEISQLIERVASDIDKRTSQGQAIEVIPSVESLEVATDFLLRQSVGAKSTMAWVSADGSQIIPGLTPKEAADKAGIDVDLLFGPDTEATITGYSLPLVDIPNGDIIFHRDMEGRLIIQDGSNQAERAMFPLREVSRALKAGNDQPFEVDLTDLIPARSYHSFDKNGRPLPFTVQGDWSTNSRGETIRTFDIKNADGKSIFRDFGSANLSIDGLQRMGIGIVYGQSPAGTGTLSPKPTSKNRPN